MKAGSAAGLNREPGWMLAASNENGSCYARYAPGKGILYAEAEPTGSYGWWLQSRAAAATGPGAEEFPSARDAMRAADIYVTAMPAGMFESLTFSEIWALGRHLHEASLRLYETHPALAGNWRSASGLRAEVLDLCDEVTDQTLIHLMPRPWQEWSSRRRKDALAVQHHAKRLPARGGRIEAASAQLTSLDFPAPVTTAVSRSPGGGLLPFQRRAASTANAARQGHPRSVG